MPNLSNHPTYHVENKYLQFPLSFDVALDGMGRVNSYPCLKELQGFFKFQHCPRLSTIGTGLGYVLQTHIETVHRKLRMRFTKNKRKNGKETSTVPLEIMRG